MKGTNAMPTVCYLVVTRDDCFCPEKSLGFYMSKNEAIKAKAYFEVRDGFIYKIVECTIMTTETFAELCPDWSVQ